MAQEIIDYKLINNIDLNKELFKNLIKGAFGYGNFVNKVSKVYTKTHLVEEELDKKIDELINIKPGQKQNYLDPLNEEEEEDEEVNKEELDITNINVGEEFLSKKKKVVGHKNKDIDLIYLLND